MNLPEAIMHTLSQHWGADNAISRQELASEVARLTRSSLLYPDDLDRRIRIEIGRLRESHPRGALICSQTQGSGYYLATSKEELRASVEQKRKQAVTIFQRARRQIARGEAALEEVVQERMF